jgi:hypothetical protein
MAGMSRCHGRSCHGSAASPGIEDGLPWLREFIWEWIVSKGRAAGRTLGEDYVEVRYEDLVGKPAEVLRSLEPFVDHDLEYERILEVGIGSVSAPNTAFKGEGQSPVGRWRTSLSPQELAEFETLTGDMLADLGYELNAKHATSFELTRMRTAYRMYFESKQYRKRRPPPENG